MRRLLCSVLVLIGNVALGVYLLTSIIHDLLKQR